MSTSITVTGSGPRKQFLWMKAAVAWADTIGPLLREEMKHEAPVAKQDPAGRNRPGRLRSSIRYERNTSGSTVSAKFTAYTPYAGYVIGGTKPHVIRPVAARYLMFYQGETQRFSKMVNHPGTKPNPFNRRAVDRMMPVIQRTYRDMMIEAIGDTSL